jgi:hypothetical protein
MREDLAKRAALKEAKKLWDNKKLHEEAKKMTLGQDHVGQDLVLSESVLDGRRVVHITSTCGLSPAASPCGTLSRARY